MCVAIKKLILKVYMERQKTQKRFNTLSEKKEQG